jgi:MFS family permease
LSYYGWRIAWALAVTQTVGYGVLYYAFSVFVAPMEAELGWSRAETTGAFSLALLLSGVVAIPVGRYVDQHGARMLMTLGSVAGALLVLAWSSVQTLIGFYLVQAAIGIVMATVFYEVAFTVIAVWFRHRRPQAMLIVTLIAGLASTIFIPLTTYLVDAFGWRDALRILALLLAVGTIPPHALVLRRHPEVLNLLPDGDTRGARARTPERSMSPREAFRAPTFWWLSGAFALDRVALIALAVHSVPLLLERGYTPALVAAAAGSIGLMQLAGRVVFAPVAGWVTLPMMTAGVFIARAFAFLALLLLPGVAGVWVFAVLFGAANGAVTLARAAMVAELYGAAHYGSISGVMTTLVAVTQTVAPLGVGALHDLSGSYTLPLWLLVGTSLLAAVCVVRVSVLPVATSEQPLKT